MPQVRRFFTGTIVLAGAIADGSAIRASLALGADLCYIGTRFIATRESLAPQGYKEMLVRAGSADLLHTPVFTEGVSCNFLTPSLAEHGFDPEQLRNAPGQRIRSDQRPWRDLWSAGQGVGLVDDVPTVAELVGRLRREYLERVPAA